MILKEKIQCVKQKPLKYKKNKDFFVFYTLNKQRKKVKKKLFHGVIHSMGIFVYLSTSNQRNVDKVM